MILPPRQGVPKMAGDEEPHLARRQAVISQFLIVIEVGNDGLG